MLKDILWFLAGLTAVVVVAIGLGAFAEKVNAQPNVTWQIPPAAQGMEMYEDAEGPAVYGIPFVGSVRMPWGVCHKPGVELAQDKHGNGIYAEDHEVIWRCQQAHPTGEAIEVAEAPAVYCFERKEQRDFGLNFLCYHNYGVVWEFFRNEWGADPFLIGDELEFIPTVQMK